MDIQQRPMEAPRLLSGWMMGSADTQESHDILWDDVEHLPSAAVSFLLIALPLSLLLPVMANFAGNAYGNRIIAGFIAPSWERLLLILAWELLMMPLLAGVAHLAGRFFQVPVNRRQAFLVVTLSTIPLWLASLALAVPSLIFILITGMVALALSSYAMYRCIRRLLAVEDDCLATLFCGVIMVCALPAWTVILALVLIH